MSKRVRSLFLVVRKGFGPFGLYCKFVPQPKWKSRFACFFNRLELSTLYLIGFFISFKIIYSFHGISWICRQFWSFFCTAKAGQRTYIIACPFMAWPFCVEEKYKFINQSSIELGPNASILIWVAAEYFLFLYLLFPRLLKEEAVTAL